MNKFAIVDENDVVQKIVTTHLESLKNSRATKITDEKVGLNWIKNGSKFEPPKVDPRENSELSRMDFMLRLDDLGLIDRVEQAVASGGVSRRAKIMWDNAASFHRQNADLIQWANDLGFSENQLDQIFGID